MTDKHDKAQYLYEDIRNCIREGLSIKEAADLCGCSVVTAANYTKDIREVKHRAKPLPRELSEKIYADIVNGESVSTIAERYGVDVSRIYTIRKRVKKDGRMPPESAHETPQKHSEPCESVPEAVENAVCEIAPRPQSGIGIFKNFTANFDGKYARYSVRDQKSIRVMVGESYCEIRLEDLKGVAGELLEVSKIFA